MMICRLLLIGLASLTLALIGRAPIPVESEPHAVEVEVTLTDVVVSLEAARLRAVEGDELVQDILAQVKASDSRAIIVPGKNFMDTVFPGQFTATLAELAAASGLIGEQHLTHIVLLDVHSTGGKTHGELNAVATIINTARLASPETLSLDAEGYRHGLSLPLPYIFLFFPYSDPDVRGSATARIAEALVEKLQADEGPPLSLTLLTSDNLIALINDARPQQVDAGYKTETGDPMDTMKNPIGLYSELMSDAREEGDWTYYNPLAHVRLFLTSLLVAPTMVVIDAVFDEEATANPRLSRPTHQRQDPTQSEAAQTAIRKENWEAGYRLLEDYVNSEDESLRQQTLQLFQYYSELLAAAPETFSVDSLLKSRVSYGEDAFKLEQNRLALYRHIAPAVDYASAAASFNQVFHEELAAQ